MLRSPMKFFVTLCLGALFLLPTGSIEAKGNRRSCLRKRWRCLKRCERKAVRAQKKCFRRTNKRRARCIKRAYIVGKKCIRKLSCPAADECYRKCRNHPSPIECHVKQGCAKKRSDCYKTCQYSPGERLKICLNTTEQKLKFCAKSGKQTKEVCQAACPTCN